MGIYILKLRSHAALVAGKLKIFLANIVRGRDAHMPFHHVNGETLKLAFQTNGLDRSPVLVQYEARSANTATWLTLVVRTAKLLIISHASVASCSLICWPIHCGSSKFAVLCTIPSGRNLFGKPRLLLPLSLLLCSMET